MYPRGRPAIRQHRRERGVFAIWFALLLSLIFSILGLALGLAQVYNRKVELQAMANATALAAARQLNGTPEGVEAALDAAAATAIRFKHSYSKSIAWRDDAIRFSDSPDRNGSWGTGDPSGAATLFYVKVDTSRLGGNAGLVEPVFMHFLSKFTSVQIDGLAIAGRTSIKVTPLAVCAFNNLPGVARGAELVQYGFRRGVVYDLMKLNPNGNSGASFVVDPIAGPGSTSTTYNTAANTVSPFVCAGKMWMPSVTSGWIRVSRGFPIGSLYRQLNSRFEHYDGNLCKPNGAPPDLNIMAFTGSWMSPAQNHPHTAPWVTTDKSWTIADPSPSPSGATTAQWGALWAYAKAVRYSSYSAGEPEPPEGYTTFGTGDMGTLYKSGLGTVSTGSNSYPPFGSTPYLAHISYPQRRMLAVEHRRVLNIPLLSCPVSAGTDVQARAVAIGKFFMTRPATDTSIIAEFAGIASDQFVAGPVELF